MDGMKEMKFWIDFEGYCSIEAENAVEAERIFWEGHWYTSLGIENESIEIIRLEAENEEWG